MQIRRVARSAVAEFMAYCHRSFLFARSTCVHRSARAHSWKSIVPPYRLTTKLLNSRDDHAKKKESEERKKENRRNTRLDEDDWRESFGGDVFLD